MKKALIVSSVASMIQQFILPHIKLLQDLGYQVAIATNFEEPGNIPLEDSKKMWKNLEKNNIRVYNVCFNRSPLHKHNKIAYHQLKEIIDDGKYSLIHCHSPVGGALTRLAAKKLRLKGTKVIYTAHGFHFFYGAPIKNWMIFYPLEKILSKYTDVLITINREDYRRALNFSSLQIEYVPGVGIDLDNIKTNKKRVFEAKKALNITDQNFVLISIGELNQNKNHQIVLKALREIDNNNIRYLIVGTGEMKKSLEKLVNDLELEERVMFLGHRDDIYELLELSDVFIFPSYREGLSKALMEAMAMGKPIIASDIRGNKDLIDNKKGGLLFNPKSAEQLAKYIKIMLDDKTFRGSASNYNKEKVKQFSLENVLNEMSIIY